MRAQGLGVVVGVGTGSKFALGDVVNGAFGKCVLPLLLVESYSQNRYD
jgi:hypothetical protein